MAKLLLTVGMAGGCRHADTARPEAVVTPTVLDRAVALPLVKPVSYDPDRHALPDADPGTKPPVENELILKFLGLLEEDAQCLAAKNTAIANMLDRETEPAPKHPHKKSNDEASSTLRRQVRAATAYELRNRSAADALERFFQLADVEARAALLREAIPVLDSLRDLAIKARAASVRYPLEPDEADRQRSGMLAQLEQAEAGIGQLNVDLRRRVGLPWSAEERLWPTGRFDVFSERLDVDMAVQAALMHRPELQGLRALEAGMSIETLATVRELLRVINPLLGGPDESAAMMSPIHMIMSRVCANPVDDEEELARRKAQAAEIRAARERVVSDEARAAAMEVNAQVARIALARGRADSWKAKVEEARKQKAANLVGSDLAEASARLEWLKARADVVSDVMAWHQARVKLKAAQGLLAWECAPPR